MGDSGTMRIDTTALHEFATVMNDAADALNTARGELLGPLVSGAGGPGSGADFEGVMVSVGSVDYPHSGRDAGVWMAAMARISGDAYVAIEEGFRAFAEIVRRVADETRATDEMSAAEFERVVAGVDAEWEAP